ncbi:MAG: hypothetical protein QW491_10135 [Thermoproteota archaeon]
MRALMLAFHHKTRKAYFGFIVTLALILYILVLISLLGLKLDDFAV